MRRVLLLPLLLPLILLLGITGAYLWVLASFNPLTNPIAHYVPWPIACTTRGCITTTTWQHALTVATTFAGRAGQKPPTAAVVLTTLIRQHLVHFGQLQSPISAADAKHYREDILHITDAAVIKQSTGLSLEEYDATVIIPLLEQESLRQQQSLTTADELFKQLAKERFVLLLPFHLRWNRDAGMVQW